MSLTEKGITFVEFDSITSNPAISKVREAVAFALTHGFGTILSVGKATIQSALPISRS